jgi:hypothetical protein
VYLNFGNLTEKIPLYQILNPGLQLPIMSLMHILLNSIDADMKSEIGSSRVGLRPYPLRFHVEKDAKLVQHGHLGLPTIEGIQYLPSQLQGFQHTPWCPVFKSTMKHASSVFK